jgi:hypothetical protein
MFFRSPMSLLLSIILIVVGSVHFFLGWRYGVAAKSEATAIGTISYITGGRSTTYDYAFEIDGVKLIQDCGTCRTALTPQGCKVGARVLVYYAHLPVLETRLQEFGEASREKYFMGAWMVGCGLLLVGAYFILKKTGKDSEESDESDENVRNDEPDVLHIAPGR